MVFFGVCSDEVRVGCGSPSPGGGPDPRDRSRDSTRVFSVWVISFKPAQYYVSPSRGYGVLAWRLQRNYRDQAIVALIRMRFAGRSGWRAWFDLLRLRHALTYSDRGPQLRFLLF